MAQTKRRFIVARRLLGESKTDRFIREMSTNIEDFFVRGLAPVSATIAVMQGSKT